MDTPQGIGLMASDHETIMARCDGGKYQFCPNVRTAKAAGNPDKPLFIRDQFMPSLTPEIFADVVAQAALAPSVHNAQPARWRKDGNAICIAADLSVTLPQADPDGAAIALSCGAATEATVLALSAHGLECRVTDMWADDTCQQWTGHRIAAIVSVVAGASPDPLAAQLPHRFTWRGPFAPEPPQLFGWTRGDMTMVFDPALRKWLADLNDASSLSILQRKAFRHELLSWMRLSDDHPRAPFDGMDLAALRMNADIARYVRLGFGPLWPVLHLLGQTRSLTAQAADTVTAPLIGLFHRPVDESPIATGRAYLRLLLEATKLGFAGWPMAALTDDHQAAAQLKAHWGIAPDRTLVQVIRFGVATGPQPRRARRLLSELAPPAAPP